MAMYRPASFGIGNGDYWIGKPNTSLGGPDGRYFEQQKPHVPGARMSDHGDLNDTVTNGNVYGVVCVNATSATGAWCPVADLTEVKRLFAGEVKRDEVFFLLSYEGTDIKLKRELKNGLPLSEVEDAKAVIYNPATKRWGILREADDEYEAWLSPYPRLTSWPDDSLIEGLVLVDSQSLAFLPVYAESLLQSQLYTASMYEDIGL